MFRPTDNQPQEQEKDIEIKLETATETKGVEAKLFPIDSPQFECCVYGKIKPEDIPIFIHKSVYEQIEEHAKEDLLHELGGVLLGGHYTSEKGGFIEIIASIRAKNVESKFAQIKFTQESWQQINQEKEQHYKNHRIVGWYHTHPGFGIFLSQQDVFIHKNFFAEPWQVALVIDPVTKDRGFFRQVHVEGKIVPSSGFYFFCEKEQLTGKQLRDYVRRLEYQREPHRVKEILNSLTSQKQPRKSHISLLHFIIMIWLSILMIMLIYLFYQNRKVQQEIEQLQIAMGQNSTELQKNYSRATVISSPVVRNKQHEQSPEQNKDALKKENKDK
ncbi:MAG: Mov34/MPN/PAD-1 family protein, partial [bacterium]|nr:Mov34/MPN/PAD-1 family protein [bacterium]